MHNWFAVNRRTTFNYEKISRLAWPEGRVNEESV